MLELGERRGGSESDLLPAFLFLPPSDSCSMSDLCAVDDLSSLSVSVPVPEVEREAPRAVACNSAECFAHT